MNAKNSYIHSFLYFHFNLKYYVRTYLLINIAKTFNKYA